MRRFKCQFEELDEKTREYLRLVRNSAGRRMPGVYFGKANPWPVLALISGPLVALLFVAIGFASVKDAWATAMLQTAGVLLGGWMVLYAFRRFMAKSSSKFAGFYHYFDPHAAYEANGEHLTVTDVTTVTAVTALGGQGKGYVQFEDGAGSTRVAGLSPPQAVLVEDYYAAMDWITKRDEAGKTLSAAILGGAAKEYGLTEQLPRSFTDLQLEVEEVPEAPEKVRRASPRLLWYLFLIGLGGASFMLFLAVNKPIRDEVAFKAAGETPTGLRAYLLDDRNTAHRAEAEEKLAGLYRTISERVRTHVSADPTLREGMAKLVDSLKGAEPPVVTIRVTNAPGNQPPLADFEMRSLQEQIGDGIAQVVGTDYIRFLVPEPGENPHIEVSVRSTQAAGKPSVICDISIRLKPDGEAISQAAITGSRPPANNPAMPIGIPIAPPDTHASLARATVLTALVGEVRNPPVLLPDDEFN